MEQHSGRRPEVGRACRSQEHGRELAEEAIPIVIHGDGATFTKRGEHSMFTVSWRGVLTPRFEGRFPLWALPKGCDTPEATRALWSRIVHLFNAGYRGFHPEMDENDDHWDAGTSQATYAGKPLCNGEYFLVMWSGAGDLEYLANDLHFPHHASYHPCWLCQASRHPDTTSPITDVRANAAWKGRLIPANIGTATHPSDHLIFNIIGCSRFCFHGDVQHTLHFGGFRILRGVSLGRHSG